MSKDSFVFYRSFYEAINELPPSDKLSILESICEFALNGKEPDLSGMPKMCFTLIKPQLAANTRKAENGKLGGAHGSKGGRPKKPNNPIGVSENNPIGVSENNPIGVSAKTPNANANANLNENYNVNYAKKTESDFQKIFKTGYELSSPLLTAQTSIIHSWLKNGYDVDLDILPEIKRLCAIKKDIKSWKYFNDSISQAKENRLSGKPSFEQKESQHEIIKNPREDLKIAQYFDEIISGEWDMFTENNEKTKYIESKLGIGWRTKVCRN